jgi:hypothetical protein
MLGSFHSSMVIPDAVSPAIGWRSWKVREVYGEPRLISPTQSTLWAPGQAMHALCMHSQAERESDEHLCGINAWHSEERLAACDEYAGEEVWGEVALWGEVSQFEGGMRAQYAYPTRLHVIPHVKDAQEIAARLASVYGVECDVAESPALARQAREQAERIAQGLPPRRDDLPTAQEMGRLWQSLALGIGSASLTVMLSMAIVAGYVKWATGLDLAGGASMDDARLLWLAWPVAALPLVLANGLRSHLVLGAHHRVLLAHNIISCVCMPITFLAWLWVPLNISFMQPGRAEVRPQSAINQTFEDRKTRRIRATAHNKVAWVQAHNDLDDGECTAHRSNVMRCRDGDTIIISWHPAASGKRAS